jgi:hypothetical protein
MARNLLAALGALTLVLTVGGGLRSAWADTSTGTNCASLLVPTGTVTASGEIEAAAVSLGCYPTYAEALYAGSGGSVQVSADTTPGTLTQTTLDASTTQTATSQVTIGTEFYGTGYSGTSQSYFASETSARTTTSSSPVRGSGGATRTRSSRGRASRVRSSPAPPTAATMVRSTRTSRR